MSTLIFVILSYLILLFICRVIDVKTNYYITKKVKGYKYILILLAAMLYPLTIILIVGALFYFLYKGKFAWKN